jgi:acyl-CoA synthetase (AMP-forming)/AMP-acid ligase II
MPELAKSINQELARLGVKHPLIISYGTSEVGPAAMFTVGDTTLGNKSGKPLPGVKARIVDKDGNELGDNQRGLLEIYAPDTHMKGYLNMPELTENFMYKDDAVADAESVALTVGQHEYPVAFLVLKQNTTDAPVEIIKRIYASAHRSLGLSGKSLKDKR